MRIVIDYSDGVYCFRRETEQGPGHIVVNVPEREVLVWEAVRDASARIQEALRALDNGSAEG